MTGLDTRCQVAVLIAHLEPNGRLDAVEAVGVRVSKELARHWADPGQEGMHARVKLERMTDLGLHVPAEAFSRGMGALADDLGPWRDGPLARVWHGASVDRLLVGLAPISGEPGGRCVITLVALAPVEGRAQRPAPKTIAALMPLLSKRACMALPAQNQIAWLTDREQDVLDRLTLGRSVREIADELGRSPHTVHDHVKSLHRKLSASSRGELVARALGHAVGEPEAIDPIVVERVRAATQIEPSPTIATRVH
ncbi:MAG: LuxR family transcriptional regulator [Planctomycetota bacterium]|nr:MAG: LuxR family transcriptional regulator [Planctomycetota bacterium]